MLCYSQHEELDFIDFNRKIKKFKALAPACIGKSTVPRAHGCRLLIHRPMPLTSFRDSFLVKWKLWTAQQCCHGNSDLLLEKVNWTMSRHQTESRHLTNIHIDAYHYIHNPQADLIKVCWTGESPQNELIHISFHFAALRFSANLQNISKSINPYLTKT